MSPTVPDTPEERQAVLTVQSAKDVLAEISLLSRVLSLDDANRGERVAAKRDLYEASDRLCNLMSLAVHQVDSKLSGQLQEELSREINALRDRLVIMGTSLMVEKLLRIGTRVESVLRDGNYPLGLSGRLTSAFNSLMDNLKLLGGGDRLSDEERQAVERTAARLLQLQEIEQGLGLMADVDLAPAESPESLGQWAAAG